MKRPDGRVSDGLVGRGGVPKRDDRTGLKQLGDSALSLRNQLVIRRLTMMLRGAVDQIGALHAAEANYPSQPYFVEKLNGPSFNTARCCCTFVRTREWRNGRRAGLRIRPGSGASCPQGQRML